MGVYVFLTNQYLPKPGATGLCVHNIAKYLVNLGNKVYTVCYDDCSGINILDGVNICRIKVPQYMYDSSYISRCKSVLSKLYHISKYPLRTNALVDSYIEAVESLIRNYDKVVIIASYTPLEAVFAAYKIKLKYPNNVKIVYYSTDTLSNECGNSGILPLRFRKKQGVAWELKLFELFDKIFIMECHKKHYMSNIYEAYREKIEIVNFPLLDITANNLNNITIENEYDGRYLNLIYAGTLYRKLRNPIYLCKCLNALNTKIPLKAFFYGSGDCDDILNYFEKKSDGAIVHCGVVSHDCIVNKIKSADVLLSIGNTDSPMAPSKIYEYMTTGKPIIHVYTDENDPCLEPLGKYGNALLLKESDIVPIYSIIEFVQKKYILDYKQLEEIFKTATPLYSALLLQKV